MSERAISRRYATALYEEASSTGVVDRVDSDVDLLLSTIEDSHDLQLLLASPIVNAEKKEAILSRLFKPHVSELVHSFLALITRKHRESIIAGMLSSYRQLRLEQQGIVEAHARVAKSLTDADRDRLESSIAKMIDSSVDLDVEEDPDLLGGVVVRIGDRVYDGSLRRQLNVLRRQLQGGKIHTN
jgi:F-type H+-transporting ATPase subunit delta